jgi:hypothetical protein
MRVAVIGTSGAGKTMLARLDQGRTDGSCIQTVPGRGSTVHRAG